MKKWLVRNWPALTAILILLITVTIILISSLRHNQGHLVYALDDPYIHMAMAKNFSTHGVWGITRYGFSSSSSSPLWTLLLSVIYFITGTNGLIPFFLNVLMAFFLIVLLQAILSSYKIPSLFVFLFLAAQIFFVPLPALLFCGQEHLLHVACTLLFVYFAVKELAAETHGLSRPSTVRLLLMAPFLTTVRYEGLFLVFVAGLLLGFRKRWPAAFLLGILGVLPLFLYGMISTAKGWFWVPNPVFLKSALPFLSWKENLFQQFFSLIHKGYSMLLGTPHLLFLVGSGLFLYFLRLAEKKRFWEEGQLTVLFFATVCFLHLQFAKTGWFYRYEAYLVALGIYALAAATAEYWPGGGNRLKNQTPAVKGAALGLLVLLPVIPLWKRGVAALEETRQATTNIYEQQYQMGLFIKKYYSGASVAANDVGAINYLADFHCLDLWGLASAEVAAIRKTGSFSRDELDFLTKSTDLVVIYDEWFAPIIPSHWIKVGRWEIQKRVVGLDSVSFYATDSLKASRLAGSLKDFSPDLPKGVRQSGRYLESGIVTTFPRLPKTVLQSGPYLDYIEKRQ